jgi:hypothetical protein
MGWTRSRRAQEETRKTNVWGAGPGEDGGRAEGSDRESDDEKGGDSKRIKRDRKEKCVVGQRMWTTEEGSGKGVERMKEEQDRQKQIPRSEKKICTKRDVERRRRSRGGKRGRKR